MPPNPRHNTILERLAGVGSLRTEALADELGVSEVTVRRDLADLEKRGLLRRTRGGAAPSATGTVEFVFEASRRSAHPRAKRAIGRAAAARIRPGTSLVLDTGTTTLEVARSLVATPGLRVLTSSLPIASLLHTREEIELVMLGGVVRKGSPDLHGLVTERSLQEFRVDVAVIGADALSPQGLFTTDQRIARVSQAMIDSAARVYLAADASKFDARSFVRFADWDRVDVAFVDRALPTDARRWLRRRVAELVLVDADGSED